MRAAGRLDRPVEFDRSWGPGLPAAEGHAGTLPGFGNWDRGALHGRYLVVRLWRDRHSVQVER